MNIRCPQCKTVFRIDPNRIPPSGARARCARCSARFMVRPPSTPADASPAADAAPATPAAATAATERAADRTAAETAAPGAAGVSPLGTRDPNARAERLARALVSDIVAYHPERRDRCLAEGTLRTEFRDEILKSWEEYVAQVGMSTARSTPYFRDALNKILAKGQQVF